MQNGRGVQITILLLHIMNKQHATTSTPQSLWLWLWRWPQAHTLQLMFPSGGPHQPQFCALNLFGGGLPFPLNRTKLPNICQKCWLDGPWLRPGGL